MLIAEKHERDLIIAEATAQMLLEALDSKDLANATKVLKKLNAIAKVSPPILAAAIKEAATEVNDFTGGGIGAIMKKATTWLAKKFGAKAGTNPILKALTLLNSLELGLSNAVDLINNNASDYDGNSDKSLMDQIDDSAAKNLRKNLAKAFQPEGVFAKIKSLFGSTGGIPYIKDVDKMVEEIMMLPAKQVTSLISAATSGESSEAAAEAAKDMATAGKTDAKSSASKSNEPVKTVDDLASAIATGQTQGKGDEASSKAATTAQENPKKVVKQLVDDISKRSNQEPGVVEKVLSSLVKKGKMKTEFKVTEEGYVSAKSSPMRLTMGDVLDAQMALLKCGRSTDKWINILFEVESLEEKTNKGGQKRKVAQAKKKAGASSNQPTDAAQAQKPAEQPQKTFEPQEAEKSDVQNSSEKSVSPVAKEIQELLKDVDISAIEAILDAIPSYLKLEAARHRSRVI